jgi:hypothetical protein
MNAATRPGQAATIGLPDDQDPAIKPHGDDNAVMMRPAQPPPEARHPETCPVGDLPCPVRQGNRRAVLLVSSWAMVGHLCCF